MEFETPAAEVEPKIWVLIPCAGSGSRALSGRASKIAGLGAAKGLAVPKRASQLPKQYHSLAGKPMVLHTLAAFAGVPRIHQTLVVVAADDWLFQSLDAKSLIAHCGGATRASSVANGLAWLNTHGATGNDWVLVHDAARCLITPDLINALIDACLADNVGGLLAQKLADTLKSAANGRVAETLDRSDKWLAQTPQMFRIGVLAEALRVADSHVTDEAGAIEAVGLAPKLVESSAMNFKITYPQDFALAEAVLASRGKLAMK